MKDILIIAEFCGDFSETDNNRFLYIANLLAEKNMVELVTSRFFHAKKKNRKKIKREFPFKLTIIEEPGYSRNVCLKRFYSHFVWGKNVEKYLKMREAPDVIYCAVPSLTAAYKTARLSNKSHIKFIIDIQDLWPEAFRMAFHVPIISDMIFAPFSLIADSVYRRADEICAVSDTYAKRGMRVNKKCKSPTVAYLGTDLKDFDQYASERKARRFSLNKDKCWMGYCGSLSSSYDLNVVIDSLAILAGEKKQAPLFLVIGEGNRRTEFEEYARKKGVEAFFTGKLPYNEMCSVISMCDMVVNPIERGSAASVINKHADYAAVGLPTLNLQESKEYRRLVGKYEMGFNCNNGDPKDLARHIEILMRMPGLRKKMGRNARKCAETLFDRRKTYKRIIDLCED